MALILLIDANGQPNKWATWQDAALYHAKGLVSWSQGSTETVIRGGDNRITGMQSIIRTSSIIAVKGVAASKRKHRAPALNNTELFRRDHHMCAYCGGVFRLTSLTRDHIIPRSRGGADTWMNVVTACAKCNQKKDAQTPEEAGLELKFAPYIPSRAEHLLLENRSVLFDQMEFLLAFIPNESRLKKELLAKHPTLSA